MKTPLVLAAALVGSLALVARSFEETLAEEGRADVEVVNINPAKLLPEGVNPATPTDVPVEARRVAPSPTVELPTRPEVQAPSPRTLAGRLERELGLSPLQNERVQEIFRVRETETAAIQARVLAAGFFDPRTTDPELARLREGSYRQISMLLDSTQNRRFAEILAGNLINDHQVISLPESLVVLE